MTLNPTSNNFKENAKQALADKDLQAALNNLKGGLISNRKKAIAKLPEFDEIIILGFVSLQYSIM